MTNGVAPSKKCHFYQSARFSRFESSSSVFMPWHWLRSREIGMPALAGENDSIHRSFYSSVKAVNSWEPNRNTDHNHHGGIFNFDFNQDGSLLVAACERRSIIMFDPLNGKLIHHKSNAHGDCVNCVKFLDSRIFATCSDDATVALWDARNLSQRIQTLEGHSNWVKNIEYEANLGLLVTSGFDGSIYTWDINNYSSHEPSFNKVFYSNSLMRSKLTPDYSKLIITTVGGFLVIVHDLDLATLSDDLGGFEPNIYRMLQLNTSASALAVMYNRAFERKRNRLEMISDFPAENQAEVIASLQVHPQGWCVVSRNTSADDNSEWTCAHNIQELPLEDPSSSPLGAAVCNTDTSQQDTPDKDRLHAEPTTASSESTPEQPWSNLHVFSRNLLSSGIRRYGQVLSDPGMDDDYNRFPALDFPMEDRIQINGVDNSSESSDDESDNDEQTENEIQRATRVGNSSETTIAGGGNVVMQNQVPLYESYILPRFRQHRSAQRQRPRTDSYSNKIYQNRPRLLHYIEEPNVGKGFIKELCFSTDGRIVCSPFGNGVRLLAFDNDCHELCDCVPTRPMKMHEVCSNISHGNVVVTTKFSPVHFMYVSGCLNGKVVFHQPVL